MRWLMSRARMAISLSIVLAAGCASAPKPTVVKGTIAASANVNPDDRGRPSPIVMKVFELKSLAAFQGADFFSVFDKDKETLGAELAAREEFTLVPNERKEFSRQVQADTRYLGAVAAFRDLERSRWRASTAIPANKLSVVVIQLEGNQVTITAQPQ